MTIRRAMPVIRSRDLASTRHLYVEMLGFEVAMEEPVLVLRSPSTPTTQLIVISEAADDPATPSIDISIEVSDVDQIHAQAQEQGVPIVYPSRTSPLVSGASSSGFRTDWSSMWPALLMRVAPSVEKH